MSTKGSTSTSSSETLSPAAANPSSHVNKPLIYDPPTLYSKILGWTFVILLFFTAYWGSVILLFPSVVFIPYSLKIYRTYCDFVASTWFLFTLLFTEMIFGLKVFVTGDDTTSNPNESAVIIANHRTRLDWFFLWSFVSRRGRLAHEKIILKDSLRKIPGFGWAMQTFCFLFISRKWENDEQHITAVLRRYSDEHYPLQLLIFPEGTDLTPTTKTRSDKWTQSLNPPHPLLEYTLYPRVKGFQHCVKILRGTTDMVYDVTIGYPDLVPQSEKLIALGRIPREIHYHVKKYPLSQLPTDDTELENWVLDRWKEKEANLKRFYEDTKSFNFLAPNQTAPSHDNRLEIVLSGAAWILLVLGCFYCLFCCWWFRWFTIFATIALTVITHLGGIERFELAAAAKNKAN